MKCISYSMTLTALSLMLSVGRANAEPVVFDHNWKEQGFLKLWSNQYGFNNKRLEVSSDGTVSLIWRPLEVSERSAQFASWNWEVREGVKATDLSSKGGDDRNLAIYFVFVDAETARSLTSNTARKLLRNPNTKALVYVWGGAHSRGSVLPSPYHPKLKMHLLRESGTGDFAESVDFRADFKAAFKTVPETLVGIGISADSDDTGGRILASIDTLILR